MKGARRGVVVYPGSFDPVHFGHLDLVRRASARFDRVIVAVARNRSKNPLFSVPERVELLRKACRGLRGVSVDAFDGLLVRYCRRAGATTILRGLRAVSDYEYESGMAMANRKQAPEIETVFLLTSETYTYLTSSIVRDIALHGGRLREMVPRHVAAALARRLARRP